jgi:phenylacetate-coenzyme A ligase PaaK-like adenylate-forming protein
VAIGASGLVLAVLARRRALRRRDRWTPERLRAHQDRALTELRRWAVRRSAFYRRFHAGGSDRPLAELPVLTKAVLMEHFDEISTRPEIRLADLEHYLAGPDAGEPYRGRWFVCATAGTTGLRGVSAWDRREWVQVLASYNRAFDWAGVAAGLTHRVSMAVVSSTNPSHQSARVGASVHSRWIPTLRIDSGDAVADIVARLNTTQPQVLVAYASMVRLLAEEQLAGRLAIAPRFVFSASEVLTDATRALARQAWNTRPFNVYGATETSGIAADCDHHLGMHLFEDLVITEVVDEHHRPVPPGTFGAKVLVTVLFSRTLPLIRYEMGDSVRLAADQHCGCGRPYRLLDAIQGREQDALRFPGLDGTGARIVQPVVFHHVMDNVAAAGWQIAQRADGHLDVLLAHPRQVDTEALADRLRSTLTARGVVAPEVLVRTVDAIPRTPLGKAPLIISPTV